MNISILIFPDDEKWPEMLEGNLNNCTSLLWLAYGSFVSAVIEADLQHFAGFAHCPEPLVVIGMLFALHVLDQMT